MENNRDSSKQPPRVDLHLNLESQAVDLHYYGTPPNLQQHQSPSLAFAVSLVVLGLLGYAIIFLNRYYWTLREEHNSVYYH
jgi:hypothetical protein